MTAKKHHPPVRIAPPHDHGVAAEHREHHQLQQLASTASVTCDGNGAPARRTIIEYARPPAKAVTEARYRAPARRIRSTPTPTRQWRVEPRCRLHPAAQPGPRTITRPPITPMPSPTASDTTSGAHGEPSPPTGVRVVLLRCSQRKGRPASPPRATPSAQHPLSTEKCVPSGALRNAAVLEQRVDERHFRRRHNGGERIPLPTGASAASPRAQPRCRGRWPAAFRSRVTGR